MQRRATTRILLWTALLTAISTFGAQAAGLPGGWWVGLGIAGAMATAHAIVKSLWIEPRRLQHAEALWLSGRSPEVVLDTLAGGVGARGEVGYRQNLLRLRAEWARGNHELARRYSLAAESCRLPLGARRRLARLLAAPGPPSSASLHPLDAPSASLHRSPRLCILLGLDRLHRGDARAWPLLRSALTMSGDDPLTLDDLLGLGLRHLEGPFRSEAEELFEMALAALLQRHGDPRLPWGREVAADRLLELGHFERVLALTANFPLDLKPPALWAQECSALLGIGDARGAEEVASMGLERHPGSAALWLERHGIHLHLGQIEEASHALERAGQLLGTSPSRDRQYWAWRLRQAEFLHWERGESTRAWEILQQIPRDRRRGMMPPLELELQLALGHPEAAYAGVVEALKSTPGHLELLLFQADCMAAMEAWEALLAFLDPLGEDARRRGDFWNLLGLAQSHLGHNLSAREALERATILEPGHLGFRLDAGHACMELGEYERAAEHWRQALVLDATSAEALVQLAETRRFALDHDGARRYLRECLLHHPDHPQAQQYLAELEAN